MVFKNFSCEVNNLLTFVS